MKDKTVNDSPNRTRQKEGGLRELTDCVVGFLYDTLGFAALVALFGIDEKLYRVTYPDTHKLDFSGTLSKLDPDSPMAEEQTHEATFTPDGDVFTYT